MSEKLNIIANENELNPQPAQQDEEFSKDLEYQEFSQALADINAELMAEAEDLGGDGERKDSEINEEETQSNDCEKEAEEVVNLEDEKSGEPTEEEKKQYKEYRLQKIFSKINCDLSSPCLKSSEIKEKINSSLSNGFNCYLLLTSKIKAVKKQLKVKPDLGAVIGIGESTYLARKWEVRQAKWAKVKEIEYILPLSVIKEGKKRVLVKEICGLKRVAGSKIKFKIALDAIALNPIEFSFALNCAIAAKPKAIVIKNFNNENSKRLLDVAKNCIGKYEIEICSTLKSSGEITSLTEVGVDRFNLDNALELAELIKQE